MSFFKFSKNNELKKVYEENIDALFRYAFIQLGSREEAQDVCSECFVRYSRELHKGKRIRKPRSFLFKIARNLIIDRKRDKSRNYTADLSDWVLPDLSANPEKEGFINLEIERVLKALDTLPPDHKEIVVLYYLEEFSVKEIAKIMDRSENAVRIIISRALSRLRELLD